MSDPTTPAEVQQLLLDRMADRLREVGETEPVLDLAESYEKLARASRETSDMTDDESIITLANELKRAIALRAAAADRYTHVREANEISLRQANEHLRSASDAMCKARGALDRALGFDALYADSHP